MNIKITQVALILLLAACYGCQQKKDTDTARQPTIVVSIEPIKLIVKEITGDKFDIKTAIPPGISPHMFEPNPSNINELQNAAAIIYVDTHFDGWIEKFIKKKNTTQLKLANVLTQKNLAITEHNHHAENHTHAIDPHFWTAPLCVQAILEDICKIVSKIDPKNTTEYQRNTELFAAKLTAMHAEIAQKVEPIKDKSIFTAHNSFAYMINEFNLKNGGVFEESPGKEASPRYIANMIDKINTANVNRIFSEPQLNTKLIKAIASQANVKIDTLDPLNSINKSSNFADFIKKNIDKLLQLKDN